jgi:hypothetical protein
MALKDLVEKAKNDRQFFHALIWDSGLNCRGGAQSRKSVIRGYFGLLNNFP